MFAKPAVLTPRPTQNEQLENFYSDPEPVPTLYHDVKDYARPDPLFRLSQPTAPIEEDTTGAEAASTRPVKRGRPSKKLATSIPQSSTNGPANFYSADKDEHIHLDIDPDIDALEDVVYGNIFPLLPPSFLSEKHGREYNKRIGRMFHLRAFALHLLFLV